MLNVNVSFASVMSEWVIVKGAGGRLNALRGPTSGVAPFNWRTRGSDMSRHAAICRWRQLDEEQNKLCHNRHNFRAMEEVSGHSMKANKVHVIRRSGVQMGGSNTGLSPRTPFFVSSVKTKSKCWFYTCYMTLCRKVCLGRLWFIGASYIVTLMTLSC